MMSEQQKMKEDVLCNGIQLKSMKMVPSSAKNKLYPNNSTCKGSKSNAFFLTFRLLIKISVIQVENKIVLVDTRYFVLHDGIRFSGAAHQVKDRLHAWDSITHLYTKDSF